MAAGRTNSAAHCNSSDPGTAAVSQLAGGLGEGAHISASLIISGGGCATDLARRKGLAC